MWLAHVSIRCSDCAGAGVVLAALTFVCMYACSPRTAREAAGPAPAPRALALPAQATEASTQKCLQSRDSALRSRPPRKRRPPNQAPPPRRLVPPHSEHLVIVVLVTRASVRPPAYSRD